MSSLTQIAVPFHSAELFLVEHDGQPYTPMKPIVEGMGLDWKTQYRKLVGNGARWGMVKMTIPTAGDIQEMICLPLRKLFAWLMSISPNKVKPEIREAVIMYQNECDDVLWDYWTKGHSINQRLTINPEQQAILHEIVARRSQGERKIFAEMWSRHNRHFKIAKYCQLLAVHFEDAAQYLENMSIKAKVTEVEQLAPVDVNAIQNCHGVLQYRLVQYQKDLELEVKRLGGKMPNYPDYSPEQVATAIMSEILQGKNMVVKLHYQGGFTLDIVPNDAVMIESSRIADLVTRHDLVPKDQLPAIMQNVMARLVE